MQDGTLMASAAHDGLLDRLKDVLLDCDADRLARLLGLRSGTAVDALRRDKAALNHLALRMAEGVSDLDHADAIASVKALLDGPALDGETANA